MRHSHPQGEGASASARFERRLNALLGELENPLASESNLLALGDGCVAAFEDVQRVPELAPPERARLRGLLAVALDAAARELEATRGRLALTQALLRAERSTDPAKTVGDWCDVAG